MLLGIQSSTGAQSGKNTVADMLEGHLELAQYAFAKPIKESVNSIFGWDERHSDGVLKEIPVLVKVPSHHDWREVCGEFFKKCDSLMTVESLIQSGSNLQGALRHWLEQKDNVHKSLKSVYAVTTEFYMNVSPREMYQVFGTEMMRDCLSLSFWTDIAPTENVIITDVRFPNEVEWLRANGGILIDVVRDNNTAVIASHSSESGTGAKPDHIVTNNGSLADLSTEVSTLVEGITREVPEPVTKETIK